MIDTSLLRKDTYSDAAASLPKANNQLGLNTDMVIQAIVTKSPDETWVSLADRLGCTRQNLDYYRQHYAEQIQNLARQHLMADVPLFYRALSEKAQSGDVPAIKLVFEHLGLEKPAGKQASEEVVIEIVARYYATNERVRSMVENLQAQRERELEQRRRTLEVSTDG